MCWMGSRVSWTQMGPRLLFASVKQIWGCWVALCENQDSLNLEIRAGATLYTHLANNCWKPGGHNKTEETMQREGRKTSSVQALNHNTGSAACSYSDSSKRWPVLLDPRFLFELRVHSTCGCLYWIVEENPKGLCGGCHGLKVNCTLIEGEMKAGARLKMSIRHARQWKPSSAPRPSHPAASPLISVQTLSSRRVSIRAAFTLNYTEHFGERMDAIPVPVLSVKGLISRSWFEERNCFCVYMSVYVDLAMMSRDAGSY